MSTLNCLREAFSWLLRPKIRKFIFFPLAINTVLFSLATYYAIHYSESLMNRFLPANSWLDFLRWLLWPLVAVSVVIVIFYSFSLVANLVASPFNSYLAAAVEQIESGHSPESGMSLTREILASIWQEVQKIFYFIMLAIPIFLISLVLPPLTPVLWFIYAAWCGALQYMDYPMANNGIFFKAQRPRLRKKRIDTLTFGSLVTLMTTIPVLNLIAMPVCVIGATLYWCRTLKHQTS